MALGRVIDSGVSATNPFPNTPIQGGTPYLVDTFSQGSLPSLVGRLTNNEPGLVPVPWQGTENTLAISNGKVVRGSNLVGSFSNQLAVPSSDGAYVYIMVEDLPTVTGLYLDLFRNAVLGSPDGYRAEFTDNSSVRLTQRVNNSPVYFGSPQSFSRGDSVGLWWYKGKFALCINHVKKIVVDNSDVSRVGYVGLSGVAAATGFGIQSFHLGLY